VINLLGVPLDENSSFLRGPALAPRKILEALRSDSSNLSSENGFDLGASETTNVRAVGKMFFCSNASHREIHCTNEAKPRNHRTSAARPHNPARKQAVQLNAL
jgi:hypothetical protein